MPSNSNTSEFRLILNRLKELGAKLQSSSQEELAGDVKELSENVRILDGNLSTFADEVFAALKRTEDVLVRKFDAAFTVLDHRIAAMEEKFQGSPVHDDRTPPSGRKMKIARLPDLSVSK